MVEDLHVFVLLLQRMLCSFLFSFFGSFVVLMHVLNHVKYSGTYRFKNIGADMSYALSDVRQPTSPPCFRRFKDAEAV